MDSAILLFSALLPVVLILIYVYRKDKNKEPLGKLVATLAVGCLSVIPAASQEYVLTLFKPLGGAIGAVYDGYVVAGFSEELWKLVLLLIGIWNSRHFDEYFDGIVYAVFLSMGFAGVENVMYVLEGDGATEQLGIAASRAVLAVPAHFLFAVTMGYFVSLAKFDPTHRAGHLFKALLYPTLLHGTYDAILMVANEYEQTLIVSGMMLIAFIYFDIKLWRIGIRRIRRMEELSRQQDFDRRDPFKHFRWDV